MKTFSNAGLPPLAVKTQLYFTADVHFSLPRRLFITLPACAHPVAPVEVFLSFYFLFKLIPFLSCRAGKLQHYFMEKLARVVLDSTFGSICRLEFDSC